MSKCCLPIFCCRLRYPASLAVSLGAVIAILFSTADAPAQEGTTGQEVIVNSIKAPTSGSVLVYPQGPGEELLVSLQNIANVERSLRYTFQITGYDDQFLHRSAGRVKLGAAAQQTLSLAFDTTGWPLGPYDGRLELFLNDQGTNPICTRAVRLGVVSTARLEKARPGEFLYGLDPANSGFVSTHGPDAFAYYRLMGVDILRNIWDKGMPETVENAGQALKELAAEGVQGMIMTDPPKSPNPDTRARQLLEKETLLKEIARRYAGRGPGKLRYFELGNEPDLPHFYPGPISEYLESYNGMYEAIKAGAKSKGLADDDTVVMNGGLSFANKEADRRAREFLDLVNIQKIDAIAYHGHGPGIGAERKAYERVYAAANSAKKGGKAYVETESGVFGNDRAALILQARTAVEKMVYGQSVGLPTFFYFRLFMEGGVESGYGMTDRLVEPRPSVLSYRNMVERLRHYRFTKTLDFAHKASVQGVDGFLFEEQGANNKATGRKAVVAFSEEPVQYDLLVRLDAQGSKVAGVKVFDLFGNPSPATLLDSNVASLTVGASPIYLTWSSPGSTASVDVSLPLLKASATEPLLTTATTSVSLSLNNPTQQPMGAQLTIEPHARISIHAEPVQMKVTLPVGQSLQIPLTLQLGNSAQPLALPHWWKVFIDVDEIRITPQQLAAMPDQLPGKTGPVGGQFVWSKQNRIDFASIAGGYAEKRPGIAYACIDSPVAMQLPCAANADWWMCWYINGEKVYDTLKEGNQFGTLANHTFLLPLKKGRNTLAVLVLSGAGGWGLEIGGPKERETALNAGGDPDHLAIGLSESGQQLARQNLPLDIQGPVPPLGVAALPTQLSSWMPLEPLMDPEEGTIRNLWEKEPDASRWYKGKKDLSAMTWLRDDGKDLQLLVAVTDDVLVQPKTLAQLPSGDSLRVVIADDGGKPLADLTGGLIANKPMTTGTTSGIAFDVVREESSILGPTTLYRLVIPKALVGNKPFRLSFLIADNDSDFLKQTLEIGDVNTPSRGRRLIAE